MVNEPRRFFVLGMPRSRTAWMSVLLSTLPGVFCTHEALRGSVAGMRAAHDVLDAECLGESSPTAAHHYAALRNAYPAARFLLIDRPLTQVKTALAKVWPSGGTALRDHLDAMHRPWAALLGEIGGPAQVVRYEDLSHFRFMIASIRWLTGRTMNPAVFASLARMQITTRDLMPPPPPQRVAEGDGRYAGLTARLVTPLDFPLLEAWAAHHDKGGLQNWETLPPMGVMVDDAHGPLAAMWAYEAFHAPVAHLYWPVTRPGLTVGEARRAIGYCIESLKLACGSMAEPAGHYSRFVIHARPAMGRTLEGLGFAKNQVFKNAYTLDF